MKGSQAFDPKPKGLWYGCGSEWLDWLRVEMPHWMNGNIFRLHIDFGSMLTLKTSEEILEFTKEYSPKNSPEDRKSYDGWAGSWVIDWPRVAMHYSGIEICPYQFSLRMSEVSRWYYGWDVASGCIWGSGALQGAEKIYSSIQEDPEIAKAIEERSKRYDD